MKWITSIGIAVALFIAVLLGRRDAPGKTEGMLRKKQEEQDAEILELDNARKETVRAKADTRRATAGPKPDSDRTEELLARIRKYKSNRGAGRQPNKGN